MTEKLLVNLTVGVKLITFNHLELRNAVTL